MWRIVEDYVRTCDTCCRVKMPKRHPYGLLEPLPIPSKLWKSISLDFTVDVSDLKGFNGFLIMVDRYTKLAHFVPCTKEIISKETTRIVMHEVFRYHDLPNSIISNRGPQLISKFWKNLFKTLKVTCNISSGYHPQIDWQEECTNQMCYRLGTRPTLSPSG
mgnify:CR=1 FL=1